MRTNITETTTWEEIEKDPMVIKLKDRKQVMLKEPDTNQIYSILWRHSDYRDMELHIHPIDIPIVDKKLLPLKQNNYILVNYGERNYQFLFEINTNPEMQVRLIKCADLKGTDLKVYINNVVHLYQKFSLI